jgi:hypothetical protein
VYFFLLTRAASGAYFSPDDFMNLYVSWAWPLGRLVRANLLFCETSPFYRPLACAWYRTIFHYAGLDAAPFHATALIVIVANIFLTYAVARRLSGSRETGLLFARLLPYQLRASLFRHRLHLRRPLLLLLLRGSAGVSSPPASKPIAPFNS